MAIVLTALIPLLGAIYLAQTMVRQTSERFFVPEIAARLDEALGLYQDLAREKKASMRHQATAMAEYEPLRKALRAHDRAATERELKNLFKQFPGLVTLSVEDASGTELGRVDRGRAVDEEKEYELDVTRAVDENDPDSAQLTAVFATDQAPFKGQEKMSQFVDVYTSIVQRRKQDERAYVLAFTALLGLTIFLAIGVGVTLARGVSKRVGNLADATKRVGAGDLDTRVDEKGSDELSDLARAFNRMLVEVQTNRARIEYLQRIGAWQDMARRLAHEIKNPLTPIQLAVQEVHQRYRDGDEAFRRLLDATLEVVEAEVGTLRRLVGEFSDFARLPQAHLEQGDLADFLREQASQASLFDTAAVPGAPDVAIGFELADGPALAYLDRQMLRRVFINLVQNAVDAIQGAGKDTGRVRVTLHREGDYWTVDIDDDGPGIHEELREKVFDPYVTTRSAGTGLGLAIAKKIVVDHGGFIAALKSPLGGARIRIQIPVLGSAASTAALESKSNPQASQVSLPALSP